MRTLPSFLAFFLMGLADAMGPTSDAVGRSTKLSLKGGKKAAQEAARA